MFGRGAFAQMEFAAVEPDAVAPPAALGPIDWVQALAQPALRRTPYRAATQQFAALVQFAPFAETVSADRWAQALSEPVRFRRRLPVHAQQFAAFVKASPFGEPVFADRWAQPLSQPAFRRRPLPVAAYPAIAWRSEWPVILDEAVVTLRGSATLHAVPTSHYKQILNTAGARLIYTAVITPWSPSDRR